MANAIGISLSGLNAASLRLSNSANNIANQLTVSRGEGNVVKGAFKPNDVVQQAVSPLGGVDASLRTRNPATVPVQDVATGQTIDAPNVDTANELVDQKMATYDFKANLKVLKVEDEMQKSLLDIYA